MYQKIKSFLYLPVILFLFWGCTTAPEKDPHVRNVILLIGDGMGLTQMYAGYTANKGSLALERSQYVGLATTFSANRYNTDSAAGGTAIACGVKTNNGMLGVTPDTIPVKSMLEYAADFGLSTGMVVTCELTHATPAAFVSHVGKRTENEKIALQLSHSKINVAIGGGRKYFEERTDAKNLTDSMRAKGFHVAYSMDEVKAVQEGNLLGLLADVAQERYPARGEMLPESVAKAINILNKNKKGFFLMVEGSFIDSGGHANDHEFVANEMLDFDRAVKAALDFAELDGHTLVIVTADHETGGMTINSGDLETGSMATSFSTKGHTGVPVPVYAFGPGAETFTGIFDNTDFLPKVLKLYGINP
ncbi:alkaline phosphatase [Parabacteroides sp. PF5-6]|uniref:alkaline phosphatase n=1 Tax=Parabacteroides sp. PF5-6 TaxID=1742403 RepID=UPI0024071617|nr:alkaline phosphatase [Parabacteroides sp. PF5-6]MDF9828731.1 alkaline phosphatase [Parabacteroides sp. PF5-6]